MKTVKKLLIPITLILLFACHRDDIPLQKPIVITVSAGLKTDKKPTRTWFGKADETLKGTPNVTALWEDGDETKIHIAVKQGGVTKKAGNVKILKFLEGYTKIIFSFELPEGLNTNESAIIYGALGNNISLSSSDLTKIVLPTSGDELNDRLVVSFRKAVGSLGEVINVQFEHIYSILCLRLQNSTGDVHRFPAGNDKLKFLSSEPWAISGGEYDMETKTIVGGTETNEVEFFSSPNAYIVVKDIQEYWAVLTPKAGMTKNPTLKLRKGTEQIADIDQMLGERAKPLEKAKTYYIAGNLTKDGSKSKLEFIQNSELQDDGLQPYIVLKYNSSTAKPISMKPYAPTKAWIDLNNNGVKDSGESWLENQGKSLSISNSDNIVTIYGGANELNISDPNLVSFDADKGDVKLLNIRGNPVLTSVEVNGAKNLKTFTCQSNNLLKSLNTNGCISLESLDCRGNALLSSLVVTKNQRLKSLSAFDCHSLVYVDVSYNDELTHLRFDGNIEMTSLDVSTNSNLQDLNCSSCPKLERLDVSKNSELRKLNCGANTKFKTFDLPNNSKLEVLSAALCALEELPNLNTQKNLRELYLFRTNMKTLDISNLPKLEKAYLNQMYSLTSLDVSGCSTLKELYLHYCFKLEGTVDVSASGLKLTKFNWSGTTKLTKVTVSQEQHDNLVSTWIKDPTDSYTVKL